MAQAVTAPAPMLPGLVDQQHVQQLIDSFAVSVEGPRIYVSRFPTNSERQQLQEANQRCRSMLRKCVTATAELETAKRTLAAMFTGYLSMRNMPPEEVDDLLNAYMMVLQNHPLFAIIAAIDDVAAGKVPQALDWPPNSPRMAQLAAKHAEAVGAQQHKLDQVLTAKHLLRAPDAPGARDRIAASLRDFHGKVGAVDLSGISTAEERARMTARQRLESRQAILKEWAHLGLSPIWNGDGSPMSPALARSLGKLNGPEAAIR